MQPRGKSYPVILRAILILLAKSRRKAGAWDSCPQGGQARGAGGRPGALSEPGGEAGDIERGGDHEVLQAGLRQPEVARVPQVAGADPLGDRPLDPGAGGVARREIRRALPRPRGPQRQVLGLRLEGEPAWPLGRPRALRAAGAGAAGRRVEADDDVGVAVRVVGRRPLLARVALGAGDVAGIPVGTVTLSFD